MHERNHGHSHGPTTPGPTANPVLSATGVTVRFGGLVALSEVGLEVPPSSIIGLVGPNGAGKSTLFAVLSGLLRPASGRVYLAGPTSPGRAPRPRARRAWLGPSSSPSCSWASPSVSTWCWPTGCALPASGCGRTWPTRSPCSRPRLRDRAGRCPLGAAGPDQVARAPVAALPLGTCRLVEVGRALATQPDVVLLDEPLSGLDMHESENLASAFRRVVDEGERQVSLLMVEHDVATVLALSSQIYVLDFGELIAAGSPRSGPRQRCGAVGLPGGRGHTHCDDPADRSTGATP